MSNSELLTMKIRFLGATLTKKEWLFMGDLSKSRVPKIAKLLAHKAFILP